MNINEQILDKIMERIDERLLASHQSKDAEISGLHREILKEISQIKLNVETFMKRVEPMLLAYEEEKIANKTMVKWGKGVVFTSAVLGSLGVILSSITYIFKKLL